MPKNPALARLAFARECRIFDREVFGKLNILEDFTRKLDSDYEWSADDLMWIHFDQDADLLEAYLADANLMQEHSRINDRDYHNALIDGAKELVVALRELHLVREELLLPHLRADGRDIVKEEFEIEGVGADLSARSLINGLSENQQRLLDAQTTGRGFLRLSGQEKTRLKAAIQSKLDRIQ